MQVDNLLTVKQYPGAFLDKKVNIKVVNMLGIKFERDHFNKRLYHLRKNLHIQLQS